MKVIKAASFKTIKDTKVSVFVLEDHSIGIEIKSLVDKKGEFGKLLREFNGKYLYINRIRFSDISFVKAFVFFISKDYKQAETMLEDLYEGKGLNIKLNIPKDAEADTTEQ